MGEAVRAAMPGAQVELYDIIEDDMACLAGKLNSADAFMIGTPTLNRDALPPVWQLLSHVNAINSAKKPCAVFGSFGWSGEAVPAVCARLASLRMNVFGDGMKINFVPSGDELRACSEFGKAFAESLGHFSSK